MENLPAKTSYLLFVRHSERADDSPEEIPIELDYDLPVSTNGKTIATNVS